MLLHGPDRKSYREVWSRLPLRQRTLYAAGVLLIWSAVVALTGAMTSPGQWAHEWTVDRGLIDVGDVEVARGFLVYPFAWAATRRSPAAVPLLTFDIKFKHFLTLKGQRDAALDRGVLLHGDDDFVPASLRFAGLTLPADVRLKGDLVDHLRGDKWAFRVKLEGTGRLFGMRRFSIMHPKGRDYHSEALFFDAARSEGVLAPRHFYADVVLNGESLGRMIVEEHFTRELLESQQRREGVIVRFDEAPFWENGNPWYLDTYRNAMIRPFQDSLVARSDVLSANLRLATGLLRGFVDGKLRASDVSTRS